jgi:ABC-2 type transport system permease protein
VKMLKMLTLTEARLLLREPLAFFWGVAFPMVLLAVMGISASKIDGVSLVAIYVPIVIAFISVAFGVQGIPVQIAGYRQGRILRRLATTPAGPARVIGAQLIVSLGVIFTATIGVLLVGRLGFGVPLPRQPWGFALVVVLSAAAMVAIGLLIGALAPTPRSAGAAATVLFTPLGAATQALGDSMHGGWPHPAAFAVLGLCTVVCAGLAARFFRWE